MRAATSTSSSDDVQRHLLVEGLRRTGLSTEQLWLRYFTIGGDLPLAAVRDHLEHDHPLPAVQRDMLAVAVNERLDELVWRHRVPFALSTGRIRPTQGPLAALVDLLDGVRQAPPERLPRALREAGRALDVVLTLYLVDYDQVLLSPVPDGDHLGGASAQSVDGTLAGRAFRDGTVLASDAGEEHRLWLPVRDGVERLGVLEARVGGPTELEDPQLREHCEWLAGALGHLVVGLDRYGDAVDRARRLVPRNAAAELVWQLLPPLTAGTERIVLSGLLHPSHSIGGDAFDYSLSQDTAWLAIFDATGRELNAGLVTAAALSTYRSVRRNGGTLFEQVQEVDQVVSELFADHGRFLTGVLAELDLTSGRLRYVAAGHPYPLLLRGGKVVASLTGGRRPLFGVRTPELTVGEEVLEPDDALLLYTDGVTQARDRSGRRFGDARLVETVERAAASAFPPPETCRQLARAVRSHQDGELQDDASMLLAQWSGAVPRSPA